ncbi:hypothetical protein HZH66_012395 [Vespula vulgaris]|uniref:Activin types I and II receptor domain-containing protein n=1 Tax=Vespula vulgaris TaxID=7454 RepID=A0A834J9W8_VESVU|nr:hypothetical protein HZH66_012395 [Vespula vulgaris]
MSRVSIHGRFIVIIVVVCIINLTRVEGRKCVCTSKDCKEAGEDTCETKYFCYTELILFTDQEFGENTTTRGCTQSPTPLLCETKSWVTRSKLSTLSSSSSSSSSSLHDDEEDEIVENRRVSSTRPWIRMPWPRLKCCDSQDYCNADHLGDLSTWTPEREKEEGKKRKKIEEKEEQVEKEDKFSIERMNQDNDSTSNAEIDQNNDFQSINRFNQNNNLISLDSNRSFTNSSSSSRDQIISITSDSISTIDEDLNLDQLLQHRVRPLHVAAFVLAIAALISVLAACYVITRFLKSNPALMKLDDESRSFVLFEKFVFSVGRWGITHGWLRDKEYFVKHSTETVSWQTQRLVWRLCNVPMCIMTQPCGDQRPSKFHLLRKRGLKVLPTSVPGVPTILTLLVIGRVAFLTLQKVINARKKGKGTLVERRNRFRMIMGTISNVSCWTRLSHIEVCFPTITKAL